MRYKIVNRRKLVVTAVLDTLLSIAMRPFRAGPPKKLPDPESVRSLLLIRTAYLGDVVMTLPMLEPLRRRFPNARITFLTSPAASALLENNPYVDEVLVCEPFWFYPTGIREYLQFRRQLKKRTFDLVIEARGDIRDILLLAAVPTSRAVVSYAVGGGGALLSHVVPFERVRHKVDYHLDIARFLGCDCDPFQWNLFLTPEEKASATDLLKALGVESRFVAAAPGSRLPLKQWPPERCAALYDRIIRELNCPVVIFGVPSEQAFIDKICGQMRERPISLVGKSGIRQVAALFLQARLVICNDSAPMHLAACVGTPVVAIFGPSISGETGPYGEGHQVVEKSFSCRIDCDENTCHHQIHQECLRSVEVEEVFSSVRNALAQPQRR